MALFLLGGVFCIFASAVGEAATDELLDDEEEDEVA